MAEIQQKGQQIKEESQNYLFQAQVKNQEIKQAHSDDKSIKKTFIVQQKLSVEVMAMSEPINPQQQQKQIQNAQQNSSRYGPFHELSQNAKALLNSQNLNYDINISPILTNITQQKSQKFTKGQLSTRQKKSQSILTEESVQEQSSKNNPQQLEKEILQLAKSIRKKVWKKQFSKANNEEIITHANIKRVQNKETQKKLRQLYQKRHSLFEKYSYPHSAGISLAQLQKQQERLKLGKYNISRVYPQEQQFQFHQSQSEYPVPSSATLNMQLSPTQEAISNQRSKSRTQDTSNMRKQSELPKLKLSFDKTHHKYKMTEFRKSILRQNKERQIAKSLLVKEKEQTLYKRRQMYNNSRYHPVGIKLSSLRLSKMANHSIIEKGINQSLVSSPRVNKDVLEVSSYRINSIEEGQLPTLQQPQLKDQENGLQIRSQSILQKTNLNTANQSEVKSSLTFNFSFGDPIEVQLKSEAQVYSELQNLTKMLQNDSTPKQKMEKIHQQQKLNNDQKKTKIWTSSAIDKTMTESKVIGDVQRLHNSSDHEYGEEQKDVELEYSYV